MKLIGWVKGDRGPRKAGLRKKETEGQVCQTKSKFGKRTAMTARQEERTPEKPTGGRQGVLGGCRGGGDAHSFRWIRKPADDARTPKRGEILKFEGGNLFR